MARKPEPIRPTKNTDGKDVYPLVTLGDLLVLYNSLPQDKRDLLLMDTINAIKKGSDALDEAPTMLRPIIRAGARHSKMQWIDDDKGIVTATIRMSAEDKEPLYTKEL